MYNKSPGVVCVIAADASTPPYLKAGYPGELFIDQMVHHSGEQYPSYRIGNLPPRPEVWVSGLFLEYVRELDALDRTRNTEIIARN